MAAGCVMPECRTGGTTGAQRARGLRHSLCPGAFCSAMPPELPDATTALRGLSEPGTPSVSPVPRWWLGSDMGTRTSTRGGHVLGRRTLAVLFAVTIRGAMRPQGRGHRSSRPLLGTRDASLLIPFPFFSPPARSLGADARPVSGPHAAAAASWMPSPPPAEDAPSAPVSARTGDSARLQPQRPSGESPSCPLRSLGTELSPPRAPPWH